MYTSPVVQTSLACLVLAGYLHAASCAEDHRSDPKAGIFVADFTITGTAKLSSDEIARIAGKLTGSCFDDDSDEIGDRVRALFQNLGYIKAEVKELRIKPDDPLGIPKPVTVEAEVAEGPQYKLGEITFVKNHAFSVERLREEFPLKGGDVFSRDKVASGIDNLRKIYGAKGFLDWTMVADTQFGSDAIVNLSVSVEEGPQYHLDKVEIVARKELAGKLRLRWNLDEGSVYDRTYIDRYIEANRDALPAAFERKDVQVVTNCPKALVEVRLNVEPVEDLPEPLPKRVACGKGTDSSK